VYGSSLLASTGAVWYPNEAFWMRMTYKRCGPRGAAKLGFADTLAAPVGLNLWLGLKLGQ